MRKKIIKIIAFVGLFLIVLGISYQIFNKSYSLELVEKNKIEVVFDDDDYIEIVDLKSLTDEEGLKLFPYHFSITNAGDNNLVYQIKIIDNDLDNTIDKKHIKLNINSEGLIDDTKLLSEIKDNVIYTGKIKAGKKNKQDFYVRLWITSDKELKNLSYKGKIKVDAIVDNGANF